MYCPKDLQTCMDDLCYGGGCLLTGGAMYHKCDGCGQLISDDDNEMCACDPFYEDDQ